MQLNRYSREIIGGCIQLDKPSVLLQETESQPNDIAYEHAYEQNAQRAAQEHLADKLVARPHGLQQAYGGSAFDNDNQQHADDRDACHEQHQGHDEPNVGVKQIEPVEDLWVALAGSIGSQF